jgi:hypothetical protein
MKRTLHQAIELAWPCLCLLLTGCQREQALEARPSITLSAGLVARVGQDAILLDTVQRIVQARHLAPAAALDLAISDSLFSERAKQELSQSQLPAYLQRLALARTLLHQLEESSREPALATDQEISALASERWWEFNRPEMRRVIHAVVQPKSPADAAAAQVFAQKIYDAVRGVSDPKEFRTRAEAATAPPLKVKVEDLPFVARDGRSLVLGNPPQPGGVFDTAFAEATANLSKVGELSPVVHSSFGYHVILLTEILPAKTVSFEEQRRALGDEALERRVKSRYQETIDALRAQTPVVVGPQAQALMASVQEQP